MKNRKTKRVEQGAASLESDEARGIRESIKEMGRELDELDRDIAEAKKGEMSCVALANFRAMRKDIIEMIASSRELYKTVIETDEFERRIEEGA